MATNYVPRVNQLDAIDLNQDINRILHDQITKSLEILSFHRYQGEINFLSDLLIWVASVGRTRTTFGQTLLKVQYNQIQFTRFKQILHFLVYVVADYSCKKLKTHCVNHVRIQNTIAQLENILITLKLLNFFRFLKTGQKPALLDYALQLDYASVAGVGRRDIGYSYMTRELIWGGFQEFLGLTVPTLAINYPFLKRKFLNMLRMASPALIEERPPILTATTKCAYCNTRPTLPQSLGCEHIFCYLCLAGNMLADPKFQCNLCDFQGPMRRCTMSVNS